jgi:DNA polymerase-4
MMEQLTPAVEPVSIDEAFLDLSGTERLHGDPPARVLARFAREVESRIGITVSIGLSYCKFLAKVASDLKKPRGFAVIGKAEARSFLADRPVTTIWGIGKAFSQSLARDGIRTVGQLQRMERDDLVRRYGTIGDRLFHLSRGIDHRTVDRHGAARSVSAETTFNADLSSLDDLVPVLRALAERVSYRLKKSAMAGRTVVLKLKTPDFRVRTRNRRLPDATRLADRIFSTGLDLLRAEADGTRFRLLGIGISDLTGEDGADPPDLVDAGAAKRARAEAAIDRLRDRFGREAVETGYTFGRSRHARPQRDNDP